MPKKPWFAKGLKFECQGSGNCCISRGQYGFVYLTKEDRKRLAKLLDLTTSSFIKKYCDKNDGFFHLKEIQNRPECVFLVKNKCKVYSARPTQCRTWPFWPETLSPKSWKKEVVNFCPGANKGQVHSAHEIREQRDQQIECDRQLISERTFS